jgi:hypothetical protein
LKSTTPEIRFAGRAYLDDLKSVVAFRVLMATTTEIVAKLGGEMAAPHVNYRLPMIVRAGTRLRNRSE